MRIPLWAVIICVGCGPVVGDPCTVNTQCGPGVCLNRDFAPGGMCSLVCASNAQCPAGSVCVADAVDRTTSGCLLSCLQDSDCRSGYVCRVERESSTKVCVGSSGI